MAAAHYMPVLFLVFLWMPLSTCQVCPDGQQWPAASGNAAGGFSHATFYTTPNNGACGYGSSIPDNIAAVSETLWSNGGLCGQCYEISCCGSEYLQNACTGQTVVVQVTDLCPDAGNPICVNAPHFDLGTQAFNTIANPTAGIIKVQYKQVPCPGAQASAGSGATAGAATVTVLVKGSSLWFIQLVFLGLSEPIELAQVRSNQGNSPQDQWLTMSRDWGVAYQWSSGASGIYLKGDVSLQLTTASGRVLTLNSCLPSGQWGGGSTGSCTSNS